MYKPLTAVYAGGGQEAAGGVQEVRDGEEVRERDAAQDHQQYRGRTENYHQYRGRTEKMSFKALETYGPL